MNEKEDIIWPPEDRKKYEEEIEELEDSLDLIDIDDEVDLLDVDGNEIDEPKDIWDEDDF